MAGHARRPLGAGGLAVLHRSRRPARAAPLTAAALAWVDVSGRSGTDGDADALWPYWSFTKTVIALLALQLRAEGRLSLDTPPDRRGVTLRHLLAHRSGLPDYGGLPAYHAAVARRERPWRRAELEASSGADGPLPPPPAPWRYSNIGYARARDAVEAAAGAEFAILVETRLAARLGLASLRLARTRADMARLAPAGLADYDPGWVLHGCLTGTAADAAALLHALATGALLGAADLAEMQTATPLGGPVPGRPWTRTGYGLGLMIGEMAGAGAVWGHSGCGPASACAVYHLAGRGITLAAFAADATEAGPEHALARRAAPLTGAQAAP